MNNYRFIESKLSRHFQTFKQALILLGARQVGKTTLLKRLYPDALYLLVDEKPIQEILETYSSANYKKIIKNHKQIFIDELHLLSNPGRAAKIIYDQFSDVQIIITGSSSLHIKNKTSESMAGRAINYILHPLTFNEYLIQQNISNEKVSIVKRMLAQDNSKSITLFDLQEVLSSVLKFGLYPDIINVSDNREYLLNLAEKAIFKDILELNLIENRSKALELLQVLAYQIGNVINYAEISRKLGLSIPTVQRYIDIFEQSFILYRIKPFSKNKREEIGKSPKIFFWDIGLRNALVKNFEAINIRGDSGALFENFIISEVKKEIEYSELDYEVNYWRVKSGYEVDLVLSNKNELNGLEIKLNNGVITKAFTNRYPEAKTLVITQKSFY